MIIKKVFDGVFDESVHNDFLKFSRGEFKNRYLIEVKRQASKWAIKTSAEFANFFIRKCLEGQGRLSVKGIIVSTFDLSGEVNFEIKKKGNFRGIRKLVIDTEVDGGEILGFMDKYPKVFFALSFKVGDLVLKIKAKAPKSGKPGKKDEDGPKADFCSLKTTDQELVKELLFGIGSFTEVKVNHTIRVDEIVYPEGAKDMKPEEVREKSKRKGVVIRKAVVNGVEKTSEASFVA